MCQPFWVVFFLLSFLFLTTQLPEFWPTCLTTTCCQHLLCTKNLYCLHFKRKKSPILWFYCHLLLWWCDWICGNAWKETFGRWTWYWKCAFSPVLKLVPVWPFIHLSVPSWRCSVLPFFNNSSPNLQGGVEVLSQLPVQRSVIRSPCLSELNVISITVKYHQLFVANANAAKRASPSWTIHFSFIQICHRPLLAFNSQLSLTHFHKSSAHSSDTKAVGPSILRWTPNCSWSCVSTVMCR